MSRRGLVAAAVIAAAVIASAVAVLVPTRPAAAQQATDPCRTMGWIRIQGPDGPFSVLAAHPGHDRVYVGSRTIGGASGQRVTLYSGSAGSTVWSPEREVQDFRVTDIVVTPALPTIVWASTLGTDPSFDGPVLGRGTATAFAAMGRLRSWYMDLAATDTDVFAAVSKPAERGVYRWDPNAGEWEMMGGSSIDSPYYRALESGSDGRLWLAAEGVGLFHSADAGRNWTRSRGSANETIRSLAVAPTDPRRVLAGLGYPSSGTADHATGLRLSDDGGTGWIEAGPDELRQARLVSAVVFSRQTASRAYAAAWGAGVFESTDGGTSWTPLPTAPEMDGYLDALLTVAPPSTGACELLYGAGASGVWVRNVLFQPSTRVYLPAGLKRS